MSSTDIETAAFITHVSHDIIQLYKHTSYENIPHLVHLICEFVELHPIKQSNKYELSKSILKQVIFNLPNIERKDEIIHISEEIINKYIDISKGETFINKNNKSFFQKHISQRIKYSHLLNYQDAAIKI